MNILGIESSCDDTSVAVLSDGEILSNVVSSQVQHKKYGGVVPEVASRAHMNSIYQISEMAMKEANLRYDQLDYIAATQKPGLLGALVVGYLFGRGLADGLTIPFYGVNHIEAHVWSHFIEDPVPQLPFVCLTVSGGHTQLVLVKENMEIEILGRTLDDAAGEAFDKIGKMLNLDYPAGPLVDKLAEEGKEIFDFPKAEVADLDFSFSGLKTAVLYFLRDKKAEDPSFIGKNQHHLCASVRAVIVDMLMEKLLLAIHHTDVGAVGVAGGVSANKLLRRKIGKMADELEIKGFTPELKYCTDNAAMIAKTAEIMIGQNKSTPLTAPPSPRL